MLGQQINSAREHATLSTNDQIATWLDELGLAQYATVFAENAIDLDVLPDVTIMWTRGSRSTALPPRERPTERHG